MKHYSRQREVILQILKNTRSHPTASWIHEQARKELPRISLGTVYRNLAELRAQGQIIGFVPGDGVEHFDGDVGDHYHFYCNDCGALFDIPVQAGVALDEICTNALKCEVDGRQLLFHGKCAVCKG